MDLEEVGDGENENNMHLLAHAQYSICKTFEELFEQSTENDEQERAELLKAWEWHRDAYVRTLSWLQEAGYASEGASLDGRLPSNSTRSSSGAMSVDERPVSPISWAAISDNDLIW